MFGDDSALNSCLMYMSPISCFMKLVSIGFASLSVCMSSGQLAKLGSSVSLNATFLLLAIFFVSTLKHKYALESSHSPRKIPDLALSPNLPSGVGTLIQHLHPKTLNWLRSVMDSMPPEVSLL